MKEFTQYIVWLQNQPSVLYFKYAGPFIIDLQAPTITGPPWTNLGAGTPSCTSTRQPTIYQVFSVMQPVKKHFLSINSLSMLQS